MNKLITLSWLFFAFIATSKGQTNIEKTISTPTQDNLSIQAEHSSITIKTWDKNEIQIQGSVKVNNKEDADALDLNVTQTDSRVRIETFIDKDAIVNADFKKSGSVNINGTNIYNNNCNNKIDSELTITIPKSMTINIESTYGGIFIEDVNKSMKINNTYGPIEVSVTNINAIDKIDLHSIYSRVDLSISPKAKVDMELETQYGKIYTDLDVDVQTNKSLRRPMFGDKITASLNGGGKTIRLQSNYSNVYIRQS